MKKYSKNEKQEIINKVINLFMNEWDDDSSRHECGIEYELPNGKIIEIEVYDENEGCGCVEDGKYFMKIDLHDPREDYMTWRYNSEFIVGRYYITNDFEGYNDWKCDNSIKTYIRSGINKIFKGLETEKD